MKWFKEFFNRLFKTPSADFFKPLQKLAVICLALTGLPTILVQFESANFTLPVIVHVFVVKAAMISAAVLWVVSRITVKDATKLINNTDKLPYTEKKQ